MSFLRPFWCLTVDSMRMDYLSLLWNDVGYVDAFGHAWCYGRRFFCTRQSPIWLELCLRSCAKLGI
ncbi:hypothetical protein DSUL_50085 [Desulfovibrionales bacterium]